MNLKGRNFLKLKDFTPEEILYMIDLAADLKAKTKHSPKYSVVKKYYNTYKPDGTRLWTDEMVHNAVDKGWITAAEFEEITGEKFETT